MSRLLTRTDFANSDQAVRVPPHVVRPSTCLARFYVRWRSFTNCCQGAPDGQRLALCRFRWQRSVKAIANRSNSYFRFCITILHRRILKRKERSEPVGNSPLASSGARHQSTCRDARHEPKRPSKCQAAKAIIERSLYRMAPGHALAYGFASTSTKNPSS